MKITIRIEEKNLIFNFNDEKINEIKLNLKEENIDIIDKLYDIFIKNIDNIELIKDFDDKKDKIENKIAKRVFNLLEKEIKEIKDEKKDFKIKKNISR